MPRVVLRWADGAERTLHPLWLRDNCPHRRHPGTRQKLGTPADVPKAVQIAALDASDRSLTIRWHDYDQTSTFSSAWLRELGSVETSEGKVFNRSKNTGRWFQHGWALVNGHHYEQNPHF